MDWIGDHLWQAWLGLAIVLGVAEMFSLDLILIMLASGAVIGMLAAVLGLPFVVQVLAALATSVAMIALVRPTFAKRLHGGPELSLGHGKLVGTRAMVTEEITSLAPGRITAAGETWTARPYDESLRIAPGETVEILQIKGATAYVHPLGQLDP